MRVLASDLKGHDGFVLVAVLSVLALMSGLVLSMLLLSRNAVDNAALAINQSDIETLEQSAIAAAGYQLFVLKSLPSDVDGQKIKLQQGTVSFFISTESGKVDLNGAPKSLLVAAYVASGLQNMTPASFAAKIMDWRDADDETRPDGAEKADYAADGLPYGPRNGAFRSIDDLRWVDGLTGADVDVLRAFLTVYNPGGRIDVFSAPGALVAALPGLAPSALEQVLALRKTRNAVNRDRLNDLLLVQSSLISLGMPETYQLRLTLQPDQGNRRKETEVVLAASSSPTTPFHIVAWRTP